MKRLKELRDAKNISQQTLADYCHVTQQSIHKYEHGLAEPDLDVITSIADYFDISIDYLIGRSDVPERYDVLSHNSIPRSEVAILNYYRTLSPKVQELIQEIIKEKSDAN